VGHGHQAIREASERRIAPNADDHDRQSRDAASEPLRADRGLGQEAFELVEFERIALHPGPDQHQHLHAEDATDRDAVEDDHRAALIPGGPELHALRHGKHVRERVETGEHREQERRQELERERHEDDEEQVDGVEP